MYLIHYTKFKIPTCGMVPGAGTGAGVRAGAGTGAGAGAELWAGGRGYCGVTPVGAMGRICVGTV